MEAVVKLFRDIKALANLDPDLDPKPNTYTYPGHNILRLPGVSGIVIITKEGCPDSFIVNSEHYQVMGELVQRMDATASRRTFRTIDLTAEGKNLAYLKLFIPPSP